MPKLNLGCGTDIKEGYINVDIIKRGGVDVVYDLNKSPYPFESDYFDEIYASHFFEHLSDVLKVMEELYRILKPGGIIIAKVPYYSSSGAFQDPTHKHFFAEDTAKYYFALNGYNRKFKFKLRRQQLKYTKPFRCIPLRSLLRRFLLNVVSEIKFELEAEK